jgi:hypothetical protein
VPSVSCTVPQPYSGLRTARAIASIAPSTTVRVLASPAVDPQHRPLRSINRHSEDAGRIGPLRGFLPRGLFNACPHALSLTHELLVKGRRRTNLNDGAQSPTAVHWPSSSQDRILRSDRFGATYLADVGRQGKLARRCDQRRPPHRANFRGRPGAAGRGVYPLCMPEVSSVPSQWPVCGEQIDSGIASRRPKSAVRHRRLDR